MSRLVMVRRMRTVCLQQCVVCITLLVLLIVVVSAIAIDVRVRSVGRLELARQQCGAAR